MRKTKLQSRSYDELAVHIYLCTKVLYCLLHTPVLLILLYISHGLLTMLLAGAEGLVTCSTCAPCKFESTLDTISPKTITFSLQLLTWPAKKTLWSTKHCLGSPDAQVVARKHPTKLKRRSHVTSPLHLPGLHRRFRGLQSIECPGHQSRGEKAQCSHQMQHT